MASGRIDLVNGELPGDLFERVFHATPSAVCVSRISDAVYVEVNPAFERLTGYSRAELVGSSPFELGIWRDADLRNRLTTELAAAGSVRERDAELRHRSGESRWVATSWELIEFGDTRLAVGMMADNTTGWNAQNELDLFFENTPDLICMAGTDGYFKRINPSFARVLGFSDADLLQRPFLDFVHPDDLDSTLAEIGNLAEGQVTTAFENRFRRQDGGYSRLSWVSVPDARGEFMLAIARDVTEQHALTDALVRATAEADRANRAKSEFLSRMSHELRTPLNVILGFAQILEMDEAVTPRQLESIGHVLKAGRHLLELIDEVLDISRIEAGHLSLSLEPVPLHDVVSDVVTLMRPVAVGRQISINVDDSGEQLHAVADRSRLRQVLLNLVSNAIKYNVDGGAVLLRVRPDDERVCIEVTDTGRGIAAHRLPGLFEPFERLGAEVTEISGTGLGLALSRNLIHAMDGTITVETEEGTGTTFRVSLPATAASSGETPAIAARRDLPRRGALSSRSVLYIEDNLANLKVVERILEMAGSPQVLSALQGSMGLDLAQSQQPDLIILDLHLPDMPGEDVLIRLLGNPATSQIPVVVSSADASPGRIERLLELGARAYLPKPLDVRGFLQTIESLLP